MSDKNVLYSETLAFLHSLSQYFCSGRFVSNVRLHRLHVVCSFERDRFLFLGDLAVQQSEQNFCLAVIEMKAYHPAPRQMALELPHETVDRL